MKLGDPVYKSCPHCNGILSLPTLLSGNRFSFDRYSDGYVWFPMMPERSPVNVCPHCDEPFLLRDLNDISDDLKEAEIERLNWKPDRDGWLKIIAREVCSEDDMIHVRLRAWWSANDIPRRNWLSDDNHMDHYTPEDKSNLSALLDMLDPGETLLMAEIHRELGQFEIALRLLAENHEDSRISGLCASDAKMIAERAEAGDCCLFEFDE